MNYETHVLIRRKSTLKNWNSIHESQPFLLIFFCSNVTQSNDNFNFELFYLIGERILWLHRADHMELGISPTFCPVLHNPIPGMGLCVCVCMGLPSTQAFFLMVWAYAKITFQRNVCCTLMLLQRNKIHSGLQMSFTVFPTQERQDVEINEWNMFPVYPEQLWSCIHSVDHQTESFLRPIEYSWEHSL